MEEYKKEWGFLDEISNVKETPYMELILPDKYAEVHRELHPQVDEIMRVEHELLRQARARDLKKRYKKAKAKRARKPSVGTALNLERISDLTADQSIESLIAELVENGIMIDVPKKSFDEFIGDYNYLAYENRHKGKTDTMPCLGELKTTIRSWVFGMGPLELEKVKSICFLGPPGCGKKHIIYAVAAEIGAVVLNLNSDVVYKYKENMPYFVHLVTKMASILQPTVLFIDGAHKPFIKKAPTKELQSEYTTLAKYLPKILSSIQPTDRILLLAATNEPWNATKTKMQKCYDKFVLVPTDQYADKFLIWQVTIRNRIGFIPNIEISSLARVNIDYSVASILTAINQVLTTSRINRLRICPLKAEEFMVAMSFQENLLGEEEKEKYGKWFASALSTEENDEKTQQKKRK